MEEGVRKVARKVVTSFGGGGFFKPADYQQAVALVVDVKNVWEEEGDNGVRELAEADIHVFGSGDQVKAGKPQVVLSSVKISGRALVGDIQRAGGGGVTLLARLEMRPPSKPGRQPYYRWGQLDPAVTSALTAYLDRVDRASSLLEADGLPEL